MTEDAHPQLFWNKHIFACFNAKISDTLRQIAKCIANIPPLPGWLCSTLFPSSFKILEFRLKYLCAGCLWVKWGWSSHAWGLWGVSKSHKVWAHGEQAQNHKNWKSDIYKNVSCCQTWYPSKHWTLLGLWNHRSKSSIGLNRWFILLTVSRYFSHLPKFSNYTQALSEFYCMFLDNGENRCLSGIEDSLEIALVECIKITSWPPP